MNSFPGAIQESVRCSRFALSPGAVCLYNRSLAPALALAKRNPMSPFKILFLTGVALAASAAVAQSANPPDNVVSAKARAIHDSALIVDTHADTPQRFLDEGFDMGSTDPKDIGHVSLDKARRGNLGAEFFSIWVDPETNQGHFAHHTFDLIDSVYEQAARHRYRMTMSFSVPATERAHRGANLAAPTAIQTAHAIESHIPRRRPQDTPADRHISIT